MPQDAGHVPKWIRALFASRFVHGAVQVLFDGAVYYLKRIHSNEIFLPPCVSSNSGSSLPVLAASSRILTGDGSGGITNVSLLSAESKEMVRIWATSS